MFSSFDVVKFDSLKILLNQFDTVFDRNVVQLEISWNFDNKPCFGIWA
jgi:hypothetical protein